MFFLNLQGFSPRNGINLSDKNLNDFYSYEDSLFEYKKSDFTFDSRFFLFSQIKINEEETFFISEPHLKCIFCYDTIYKSNTRKIVVNNDADVASEERICILKRQFYNGYKTGYKDFESELGISYISYDLETKLRALESFAAFCLDFLHFKGFATPTCLYILGYIQANYVRVCGEYNNLLNSTNSKYEYFSVKEIMQNAKKELKNRNEESGNSDLKRAEKIVERDHFKRLKLNSPSEDIIDLWMILLEIDQMPTFLGVKFYKTEEDILNLLGMLFSPASENDKIKYFEHTYQKVDTCYLNILNFLAHTTFKRSPKSFKLLDLSICLKQTFSCYETVVPETIKGNIHGKLGETFKEIIGIKSELSFKVERILRKIKES